MYEITFKPSFKRNFLIGIGSGCTIVLIFLFALLVRDLEIWICFIGFAAGVLLGILWGIVIKPKKIVGINDNCIWIGKKKK